MTSGAPDRIKLLSYNIHKGATFARKRDILEDIRDAIRAVSADIVFLQEVHGEYLRFHHRDPNHGAVSQLEFLADSVWHHYAYGKNAVSDFGHHGNAILSRFPIVEHQNLDISQHRFEKRGLLQATLEIPETGLRLRCLCTHFGLFPRGQRAQLAALQSRLGELASDGTPTIIGGDLNDYFGRSASTLCRHNGVIDPIRGKSTYPALYPVLPLDRVLLRNCSPISAAVLSGGMWSKLSDHAAVTVEIELPTLRQPEPQ